MVLKHIYKIFCIVFDCGWFLFFFFSVSLVPNLNGLESLLPKIVKNGKDSASRFFSTLAFSTEKNSQPGNINVR